ncbi:hypothetical protein Syun_003163 [Stephania yunnanensis]|uniref:Uncharacterized protein n=1 Tax=Stephania yunnanensis TaxID=152371 RepID=A0AAP0L0V3_9MAGN
MIQDILMYMDMTFIPSTHKTPVHTLGLNLWRDNVIMMLMDLGSAFSQGTLLLIYRREGEQREGSQGPAKDHRGPNERERERARRVTFEGSARTSGGGDGGGGDDARDEAATVERGWRRGTVKAALVEARDGRGRWRRDGGGEDGLGTVEARTAAGDGGDRRRQSTRPARALRGTVEAGTVETGTVETGTVEAGTISVRQR